MNTQVRQSKLRHLDFEAYKWKQEDVPANVILTLLEKAALLTDGEDYRIEEILEDILNIAKNRKHDIDVPEVDLLEYLEKLPSKFSTFKERIENEIKKFHSRNSN